MFSAFRKQALKVLSTGARHRIHTLSLPYSGPPTYETITRRFSSSNVDPQAYCIQKRQEAARQRGEHFDIHDIGELDPTDYDVLIPDVDSRVLREEISEMVGIKYLAAASSTEANKVVDVADCFLFGRTLRTIFPAVVCDNSRAHWVFFIVASGSPLTYLSTEGSPLACVKRRLANWLSKTSDLFDIKEDRIAPAPVKIAGRLHPVHRAPNQHSFTELNILGMDYFNFHDISQKNDFKKARAKLYFGPKWEMVKKPKL